MSLSPISRFERENRALDRRRNDRSDDLSSDRSDERSSLTPRSGCFSRTHSRTHLALPRMNSTA